MIEHGRRIEPAEFQRCVTLVAGKIDALAVRLGVSDAGRLDLEETLARLPPPSRGRAGVMLDGIVVQTCDDNPAMAMAARYVRALANDVWESAGGRC